MKTIVELTREAGGFDATPKFLERFAELVRSDERETCAYRAGIALLGTDRGLSNRVDQAIRNRSNK